MFENTGLEDLLNSLVSILWFVCSLTVVLLMIAAGYDLMSKTKNQTTENETIIEADYYKIEDGYFSGEELKYDGALEGYEVYASIINAEDDMTIYVKNGNVVTNLSGKMIYNQNFIDYIQNVDCSKLDTYVDTTAMYVRRYTINAHGDVVEIIYEKVG